MTKIYLDDLNNAEQSLDSIAQKELVVCKRVKTSIEDFINNSHVELMGTGYDATRKYFREIYLPLLEESIDIFFMIVMQNSDVNMKSAIRIMQYYMDPDVMIDDSVIPQLKSEIASLNSQIAQIKANLDRNPNLAGNSSLGDFTYQKNQEIYRIEKMIDKINQLVPKDLEADAKIEAIRNRIVQFKSKVNSLMPLSGDIDTSVLEAPAEAITPLGYVGSGGGGGYSGDVGAISSGGEVPETAATPEQPLVEEIPPIDPNTLNPELDPEAKPPVTIEDSISNLVLTASALIGLTSSDLAIDPNSGIADLDNYAPGENWNSAFVNDLINRDPEFKTLLQDYYNNPQDYPNSINSPNDLLKYAMKDNSNMEFNWSDGSINSINNHLNSQGMKPESYTRYVPKEGDVIFLDTTKENGTFDGNKDNIYSADRVGIVESVEVIKDKDGNERTIVTVIEGDVGENPDQSKVSRTVYDLDSKEILGYGTIKKYDLNTDTSNQNPLVRIEDSITGTVDSSEVTFPGGENPDNIKINEGDSVGNIEGNTGGTVDSEGIQRDSEGNVIGEVNLEEDSSGSNIVQENDIPSQDTTPEENTTNGKIDMSDYSKEQGEYFQDIDENLIVWDYDEVDA